MNYPIIDTHFHIWERAFTPIEWIKNSRFDRDFTFDDYLDAYQFLPLIGGIYIEVDSSNKEQEFSYISNLARQKNKILGIAPYLTSLNPMRSFPSKICSAREVLHTQSALKIDDPSLFSTLKDLAAKSTNIAFEVCVKPESISYLSNISENIPQLKLILNHFGNPNLASLKNYQKDLIKLKQYTNIYCKLSPSDSFTLEMQDFFQEIFAITLDTFGKDRLLFGSNYPVSNITPAQWVEITTKNLEKLGLSSTDIARIYKDNAYLCYQINPPIQRFGQIIKVKKEKLEVYLSLHKNTPKGVNDAIKKANIQNYSIYIYGDFLFAYFEYIGEDFTKDMKILAQDPTTKKWWESTDPCQISLSDTQQWLDIKEVFHLD